MSVPVLSSSPVHIHANDTMEYGYGRVSLHRLFVVAIRNNVFIETKHSYIDFRVSACFSRAKRYEECLL